MSNAGSYWQCSGCGRKSWATREVGRVCAMSQPNGQTCTGRFLAPQAAPSGDEATVREILDRTGWFFEAPRDKAQLVGHDEVIGLLREAYAAGKADERWAFLEGLTCDESETGCSHTICSDVLAIARRGSEGK